MGPMGAEMPTPFSTEAPEALEPTCPNDPV